MNHIFDSIHTSDMLATSTGVFSSLAPVIALLLGILFGIMILSSLVSIFSGKVLKKNTTNSEDDDYEEDDDFPY
jgi:predicted permease